MPNKLHFYTKLSKEKIKLSNKPIASGGEGALYPVASPRTYKNLIAKIYHPDKRDAEREAKMIYLIQHPPIVTPKNQHQPIAWVLDLIYQNEKFAGILMYKIKGKKLTKLTLSKLSRKAGKAWKRFAFGQPDALKLRLRICFNIAVVIHQIHESEHYVLVDLKPDNILMQPNGLIAIVDMDSVEVIEKGKAIFPAPVATPEYTPPEHYTQKRKTIVETWDRFGMGVLFYQLLFGLHPFAASANPPYDVLVSLDEKIKQGLYVHIQQQKQIFKIVPPPHKRFYDMQGELQDLFQNCFEDGHAYPEARPSALKWCIVLARLLNLPFNHSPNLIIPPSDLYFLPSSSVDISSLTKQIPSTLQKIPTFLDLIGHKTHLLPVEGVEGKLQDQYHIYINDARKKLTLGVSIVLLSFAAVYWFEPLFSFLGFFFLVILFYQILFVKNKQAIDKISKKVFNWEDKKTNSDVELLKKDISKQQEKLDLLNIENRISRSKFDSKNLNLITKYIDQRTQFKTKTNDLKNWTKEADSQIKLARQKELKAYEKETTNFQKSLERNPLFEKYNFYSATKLKNQIEVSIQTQIEALKKINNQKHLGIKEEQEKQLKKLNYNFAIDLSIYKKKREKETIIAWRKLTKKKVTPRDFEADYNQFLQKQTQLKIRLSIEREKIDKLVEKSFLKVRKDLRLNSEQELNRFITLLESIPEEEKYQVMQICVSQQLKVFSKQLRQLQSTNNPHIKQVADTLENFDTKPPLFKKKVILDYHSVNTLCTVMIGAKKKVEKELKILEKEIQQFLVSPAKSIPNTIDISQWRNAIQKQIARLQLNLEQHIKLQKQFFIHSTIFELKIHLKRHNLVIENVEKQYQNLEEKEAKDIARLKKKHKTSIEFSADINEFNTDLKDNVIPEQKRLYKEAEQKDIIAHRDPLRKQLNLDIKASNAYFNKIVEGREEELKENRDNINSRLKESKKGLKELNLLHHTFEAKISTIRKRAEIIYTNNKKLVESKYKELNNLLQSIQEDHKKALEFLNIERPNYQKILNQEKSYEAILKAYKNLNTEKIEIEVLLKLEKDYNPKTFIKDLLLDRVDQFGKKNAK